MNLIKMDPLTYATIRKLVTETNQEIGGLCLCYREEQGEDTIFKIKDVLIHPQYRSGGRITTDDAEYSEWLNSLDDETFNHIRCGWHSHNSMGVFASGTDIADQQKTRSQLNPDDFYIHLIINHRDDKHWFVYNKGVIDEHPEFMIDVDIDTSMVKDMKDLPRVDYSKYIIEERTSGLVEEDDEFDSLIDDGPAYRDTDLDDFLERYRAEKIEEAKKYQGPDWLRNWFKTFKN